MRTSRVDPWSDTLSSMNGCRRALDEVSPGVDAKLEALKAPAGCCGPGPKGWLLDTLGRSMDCGHWCAWSDFVVDGEHAVEEGPWPGAGANRAEENTASVCWAVFRPTSSPLRSSLAGMGGSHALSLMVNSWVQPGICT
jgi:hypothetical protein